MRKVLLIAGFCSLSGLSMSQNIGENFEAGGYILDGYGSVQTDDYSSDLYISGGASFLVSDGVSVRLGAGIGGYNEKMTGNKSSSSVDTSK